MKELDKAAQAAVRDINRKLLQQIRSDWEFPSPSALPEGVPPLQDEDPPIVPSGSSHRRQSGGSPPKMPDQPHKPRKQMRERYYGTTDESSDEEAHMILDMYAFDSPDTVGEEVDRKATARKKRKRKDLEAELEYNPGLCFFLRRRNAWTGAVARNQYEGKAGHSRLPKLATSSDSSPVHTPTSVASVPAPLATESTEGAEDAAQSGSQGHNAPISPWIPYNHTPSFRPPANPDALTDVLVPVAPPLIPPSNPVRISLTSRSQSELYGRIVRDSRTPAIPVNLADMTRIIVQGWKDEGNWPPRGTAPEPSIATRRAGDPMGHRVSRSIGSRADDGLLAHHPHLQRGVEGVKRVFRLSSGSHHGEEGLKSPKSPAKNEDLGSAFRSH